MPDTRTIDMHAHILLEDTARRMAKEAADVGPRLSRLDAGHAHLDIDGGRFLFAAGGWDLALRLHDMDESGVDMQVLSNVPPTFLYGCEPSLGETLSAIQNEAIAATVAQAPDRFLGLATVPMQDPERAAAELRRAMTRLGLRGVQIGSHVQGRNLDDPALEPVWQAAEELGAFILIHPQKVAGADRQMSYYLTNLIGNPLDTTIAGASLVFGGVLERHPGLTVCLPHGGGFAPYQAGRWAHGWQVRPEPKQFLEEPPQTSIGRLYFDCILHSDAALDFLVDAFGAERVVLGSDYPFDMGLPDCVSRVRALDVPDTAKERILRRNAMKLLGLARKPEA